MSCKYNNCKHCGYKSECEIYKENAELKNRNTDLEKELKQERKINEEFVDLVAFVSQSELQKKGLLTAISVKEKEIERLHKVQDDIQTCLEEYYNEMRSYKNKYEQAKDLLKRCYEDYIYLQPLRREIEQFLKENK